MDEISDLGERVDSQDLSDEDQDMSDGGANISLGAPMPLPYAEELNAEMDMLDAEIMGSDIHDLLFHDSHYQSTMDDDTPFYYSGPFYADEQLTQLAEEQNDMMDDGSIQGVAPNFSGSVSALPAVMSELSQQLQHIQDGQEHGDFTSIPDAQNGTLDNSISPLPFSSQTTIVVGDPPSGPPEDFSSEYQQIDQYTVSLGGGSNPLGLGSSTPAHAEELPAVTQTHQFLHNEFTLPLLSFPSSDTNWEEEIVASEADEIEVEDQYNLSLGEFLSAWGRTMLREEEPKRRSRGPALSAVSRQRNLQNLAPMEPCDLQGDRCDIQRIDWRELGITRSEAREMRRQTYKNYTNLRVSHRPLVSTSKWAFLLYSS
jgi:hypothetical protein